MTTIVSRQAPRGRVISAQALRVVWLLGVPCVLATAMVLAPASAWLGASPTERWLGEQPALTWLSTFFVATTLLRYWRRALPPAWAWSEREPSTAGWTLPSVAKAFAVVMLSVCAALALRALVLSPFKVRTASMVPTLAPNDVVIVSKLGYGPVGGRRLPQRGSLILLETPDPALRELDTHLFKRVVGLPGDLLTVEQGVPSINGWRVPRCSLGRASLGLRNVDAPAAGELSVEWLGDATYLVLQGAAAEQPDRASYTVRPNEVWVLGDNRRSSSDSRTWFGGKGGGAPLPNISGIASWVYRSDYAAFAARVERSEHLSLPRAAEHLAGRLEACLRAKPTDTTPPSPKTPELPSGSAPQ
jgi:signal peptidase I